MNDHDQLVQRALAEFPDSTVSHHSPAVEIHGRILALLGEAIDGCEPVPVQCPRCQGGGCSECTGGRVPFANVRDEPAARLELGGRILEHAVANAEPRERYWLEQAREAVGRRREQCTGGR